MKSSSSYTPHPSRGLALLSMHERCHYFKSVDDCRQYGFIKPWQSHPFGLTLPTRKGWEPQIRIDFVGAHGTDMTVESFIAHIREHVGYTEEMTAKKLRVISVQCPDMQRGHHFVFFEFWTSYHVVVSGETTDFSGAGNAARCQLEDVFAVLSSIYGVPIERVTLKYDLNIDKLYAEQEFQTA